MAVADPGDGGAVRSVDRAATVLEVLAREGEATASGIARELGVHPSTVSRLLGVLEAHHLVERTPAGPVRLGTGVLRLAAATRARLDLVEQAREVCEELAQRLGETVNLAVYRDGAAINLHQSRGSSTVVMHNWVGDRTVLHATASGKVLLAHRTAAERARLLGGGLERFTDRTRTEVAGLEEELGEVRRRGWAQAVEEYEVGLNAVAVPVLDGGGDVVAALSAAGPAYRLEPGQLAEAAALLAEGAREIGRRMGFGPAGA